MLLIEQGLNTLAFMRLYAVSLHCVSRTSHCFAAMAPAVAAVACLVAPLVRLLRVPTLPVISWQPHGRSHLKISWQPAIAIQRRGDPHFTHSNIQFNARLLPQFTAEPDSKLGPSTGPTRPLPPPPFDLFKSLALSNQPSLLYSEPSPDFSGPVVARPARACPCSRQTCSLSADSRILAHTAASCHGTHPSAACARVCVRAGKAWWK